MWLPRQNPGGMDPYLCARLPFQRRRPLVARPFLGSTVVRFLSSPHVMRTHSKRCLRVVAAGLSWLTWGGPAGAGAICPSSSESLRRRADSVVQAYAEQDRVAYPLQRDLLFEELACIDEIISKNAAARVHLVMALDAFMSRQELDARSALKAVAESDPTLELDAFAALPPTFELWLQQARAQEPGASLKAKGDWAFDGVRSNKRPSSRSTVAQQLTRSGEPTWTAIVSDADSLPTASRATLAERQTREPDRRATRTERGLRRPVVWWTASGLTGAAAVGFWVGTARAGAAHQADIDQFQQAGPLPESERAGVMERVQRANSLGRAAQGLTVVSAGFGAVALTLKF